MGALGAWLAAHWREWLLVLAMLAVSYLVLEIGYRGYQSWALPRALFEIVDRQKSSGPTSTDQFMFDVHVGYRYTPNFVGERGHPWFSHWRTNSHGHVSQFEYPRRKPPGEYRIAVVGDSMTANITNNVRWTEVVEEQLNASARWRASVGERLTRVINFGVDGYGMLQFAATVRHHAMDFEPDLIIVNFLSDSFLRRLRYSSMPSSEGDRERNIRVYVQKNYLDGISWFSPYPELFAATAGRFWGMQSSLPVDPKVLIASSPDFRFARREEAIAASAQAIRDVLSVAPNILFLQIPLIEELEGNPYAYWVGLIDDVQRIVPQFQPISMKPQMDTLLDGKRYQDRPDLAGMGRLQILALPPERQLEYYRWFFLPHDHHYTDYGTTLYADEVARFLIEKRNDHGGPPTTASGG
ncbi:MAG: hypothetical protein ACJ8FV_18535 [Xanthobacteraceae bacterium]